MLKKALFEDVVQSPGVYLMLDNKSSVLYVGKAKNLYKRLSSYSRFTGSDHNKTTVMLSQVLKVDTLITRTEKEALILEASLIKKHNPKYNIILRDDKNYPLIKVTVQEQWPRVFMARRRIRDGARYFGPYSSSSAMWSTLKTISKLFPLRRCKGSKLKPRTRPCLNHQMGQCLAPCMGNADHHIYSENVKKIIMILEGKSRDLISELTVQMNSFAENLDFEKAARRRDQIAALSRTLEKQIIVASHQKDQDIFGLTRRDASVSIAILNIRNGIISGNRTYFLTDTYGDDQAIISQVINQYYFHGENIPKEIIVPVEPVDMNLFEERFTEVKGAKVQIISPQRGDKLHLLKMAIANSDKLFEEKDKKDETWATLSDTLVKKLKLPHVPSSIECLDISNTGGQQAVGSLVRFQNGEAYKKGYRHYKIQTVMGPDDYGMMAEVLRRRFQKGCEEDNLPELFMVDGGKGQLGVALKVIQDFRLEGKIDLIGIAKEKDEEGEKLYKPFRKNPILLKQHDPVLLYLMRIRDESHRFGITFHRKLRSKKAFSSELDSIENIGPSRKKKLLKTLGSVKRIKKATLQELESVSGVGKELAQQIYDHFHSRS